MAKAIWNGVTLAESDDGVLVEGNVYFPRIDIDWGHIQLSDDIEHTYCHWKGMAEYYDVFVGGETNEGAAWSYADPYEAAAVIDRRNALWKGVEIIDGPDGQGLVEEMPSLRGDKTGWEALCWYLKTAEGSELTPEDISKNTDIPESELMEVWRNNDVQRYAAHYKWKLSLHLEKTE